MIRTKVVNRLFPEKEGLLRLPNNDYSLPPLNFSSENKQVTVNGRPLSYPRAD